MVMENFDGQVAIFTKETIWTMRDTDMEKCTGLMEAFTKVNGVKVFNTVMVKCISLMDQRKLEFLKIMFSKVVLLQIKFIQI